MLRGTFASLGVPAYRLYAAGAFASNVGTWMQGTAQAWLVYTLTDSAAMLGLTVGLQLLPMLLLAQWGGVLADSADRRTLLRRMQVAMALPSGVLAVLTIAGAVEAWQVVILALVFGIARAVEGPARVSFVSELVPGSLLVNAIALNSASVNSARLVGPGLAGVLIGALGSGVFASGCVIAINAATYGATWLALSRLTPGVGGSLSSLQGRRGMRDALTYVRTRPDLSLALACVFFLGGFGLNFETTNTVMVTEQFDLGAREFGLAGSALALGSLAGALVAATRLRPRLRTMAAAGLVFAALQILSGMMPTYTLYLSVLPLIGLFVLLVIASANAMIQTTCAPDYRGRVAALYQMVFIGSVPLTGPLIGWLGEHAGPRVAIAWSGAAAAAGIVGSVGVYLAVRHRQVTRAAVLETERGSTHARTPRTWGRLVGVARAPARGGPAHRALRPLPRRARRVQRRSRVRRRAC